MAYSPLAEGALKDDVDLKALATSLGATASQLALAWLARRRDVVPIPKAGSHVHLEENLKALDLELSAELLTKIDQLFAPPRNKRPLATI